MQAIIKTDNLLIDTVVSTASLTDLAAQFDTWKTAHPGFIILETTITTYAVEVTANQVTTFQKEYAMLIQYTESVDSIIFSNN